MLPAIYTERIGRGRLFISSPVGFMFAGLAFRPESLRHNYVTRDDDEAARIIQQDLVPCTLGATCVRCRVGRQVVPGAVPLIDRRDLLAELRTKTMLSKPAPVNLIDRRDLLAELLRTNGYRPVHHDHKRGRTSKTWQLQVLRERAIQRNAK